MILRKYGVELRSLSIEELDLVRSWRNSEEVSQHMFFQYKISEVDQLKWFKRLNKESIYLTIHFNDEKLGLINIKNINWVEISGEAGIFVGLEKYKGSIVPTYAIYCLMDAAFTNLGFNKLFATIKKSNLNAIKLNQELGYKLIHEDESAVKMHITREEYEIQKSRNTYIQKLDSIESHSFSEDEKNLFKISN